MRPGAIYAALYLAYSGLYVARLNFSVVGPVLEKEGYISLTAIGTIGAVFSLTFALGKLLLGTPADKIQPRWVILAGCLGSAASNILLAFTPPLWLFILLWAINGLAQSVVWGPLLRSVSAVAGERSGKVMTLIGTCVAVGSLLGLFVSSQTVALLPVGWAFAIPGLLLALLALPCVFLPDTDGAGGDNRLTLRQTLLSFTELLKDRNLRLMMIPAAGHGAIKETLNLWVPAFFVFAYHLDVKAMGWFIYAVPAVALLGRVALIVVYRLFKQNELAVACFFMTICAAASVPLVIGGLSAAAAAVCLGICSGCIAAANGTVASFFPLRYAAGGHISAATGVMDFATYAGGAAAMYIFGFVIDFAGYQPVFISFIVLAAVSAAVFALVDRLAPRKEKLNGHN